MRVQQKRLLFDAAKRFLARNTARRIWKRGAKHTFTFPLAQWLSRDLRSMVEETFASSQLASGGVLNAAAVQSLWHRYEKTPSQIGWSRIWSLFVLVRWCEMMGVRP